MAKLRKNHEARQAEIIQGALEVASEQGLGNVTTQAIADRVGIAQPTIFRHFKNRDAIFRAAMETIAGALFKALEGIFVAEVPADVRLQRMLERQLKFVAKQRGVPRLLFSDRLHLEDPELKATVRRIMSEYTDRLAGIVADGVASGRFRPDLEAESTARFIAATIQGVLMRWSISDFSFSLEQEARPLWEFLWRGLAPTGIEDEVSRAAGGKRGSAG